MGPKLGSSNQISMPDIHLNKVIDGQCKFEVYNIDVRTLIVWYLVYLSGSFLD